MGPTFPRLALAAAVAALVCAAAPQARADFEGRIKITHESGEPDGEARPPGEGRIRGKGTKWRMDMQGGPMGPASMIFDFKGGKGLLLVDQRKMAMTFDLKERQAHGRPGMQGPGVRCETDDATTCLQKNDFKKTGTETVNGHKADRWERDREDATGEPSHQTLWIPQGFGKDFAFVRQQTKSARRTETSDVLDLKKASVPDDIFEKPAGYQEMDMNRMGPGMRPGGPGMRPPFPPGGARPPGGGQ